MFHLPLLGRSERLNQANVISGLWLSPLTFLILWGNYVFRSEQLQGALGMTARAGTFRIKLSRQVNSSPKIVLSQQEVRDSLVVQQRLTLLTEIFSVVDGVLLRPLPYPHAEQIVQLREVSPRGARMAFAEPNFLDLRARTHTLTGVGQYSGSLTTVVEAARPLRSLATAPDVNVKLTAN